MSKIYQYGYKLIPLYFTIIGILCIGLYWISYPLFDYASLNSYLSKTPQLLSFYSNNHYSITNLIAGFLLIFIIGIHLTVIIGGITAIYWSEFTNSNFRKKGTNIIEIFANIPFVVYGFLLLALFIKLTDLQDNGFKNMLISGLTLGLMMLPMIVYKFIGILQSISYQQREGAYSLGASRYHTAMMVLIPSQSKLFLATIINTATRTFCEILIVVLVAGFTSEKLEVIISIFIISTLSIIVSQWLNKSHHQNGAI